MKNVAREWIHSCWEYHGPVLTNARSPVRWNGHYSSVFVFGVFFYCQTKWICLTVVEWGLWNNSWVKNLPVRPLAPRRKTPRPAVPRIQWPPGLGQKYSKTKYLCWGRVLAGTVSNKLCDYINTKLGINNELTLMIPSASKTSLFTTVGFWTPLLSSWWIVDQFAKSAVLFSLRKKIHFHSLVNSFITRCWLLACRYL